MALLISRNGLSFPSITISSYTVTARGTADCTSIAGGGGGGGGGGADGVSATAALVTVLVLCRLRCPALLESSTSSRRDVIASSLIAY